VLHLGRLLENLDKMLRRLIGEDILFRIEIPAQLPYIKADPGQLEQVIMNLVVNARDAVRSLEQETRNKAITVSVSTAQRIPDENPLDDPVTEKTRDYLLLSVRDTGIGIPEDVQERIFDPFFTTKMPGQGTGLGLSMVYGIVRQNEGLIEVDSQPGKGTEIRIFWPVPTDAETPRRRNKNTTENIRGTETILLVEDDRDVLRIAATALQRYGFNVLQAENGNQALEVLNTFKQPVTLLITDVIMPEMNGRVLADRFKKRFPNSSILFTSGYTDDQIQAGGVLSEDIHLLPKPYSIKTLASTVRKIIDKNAKS
jgi:CheY-like chemotaxis protein